MIKTIPDFIVHVLYYEYDEYNVTPLIENNKIMMQLNLMANASLCEYPTINTFLASNDFTLKTELKDEYIDETDVGIMAVYIKKVITSELALLTTIILKEINYEYP